MKLFIVLEGQHPYLLSSVFFLSTAFSSGLFLSGHLVSFLNLYCQLFLAHPASLIAKSMLKVREQGVAGTASDHGYPLPPLPRNVCVRTCVSAFFVSLRTSTHPSICPISTCAEAQPPDKLTVKRLPEPSVAISSFNSTRTPLSIFPSCRVQQLFIALIEVSGSKYQSLYKLDIFACCLHAVLPEITGFYGLPLSY